VPAVGFEVASSAQPVFAEIICTDSNQTRACAAACPRVAGAAGDTAPAPQPATVMTIATTIARQARPLAHHIVVTSRTPADVHGRLPDY
jgi:hypothetical protein